MSGKTAALKVEWLVIVHLELFTDRHKRLLSPVSWNAIRACALSRITNRSLALSIKVSISCMCTCCKRHNGDRINGKCSDPANVAIGISGVCLWIRLPKEQPNSEKTTERESGSPVGTSLPSSHSNGHAQTAWSDTTLSAQARTTSNPSQDNICPNAKECRITTEETTCFKSDKCKWK